MTWQRRARFVIAIAAVAFAIVVVFALDRRNAQPAPAAAARIDPGAVVEVTGGRVERFKLSHEDVRVEYERQLTYANGSTKLFGITISVDNRGGRSFTVRGKEGEVGQNESTITLSGDVQLASSDEVTARTEHASYSDKDGFVRGTGPVEFSRGRTTGSGIGMTYDTAGDVLVILDRAIVHVAPDERGAGAVEISSGTAAFARRQKSMRFEREVKLQRGGQTVDSDTVVAYLTDDEKQIDTMKLGGHSRMRIAMPIGGGLQELGSRDMDVKYGADGQALERAVLTGDAAIVVAGVHGSAGREIRAKTIDVALAPDGVTPVSLSGREAVQLTLPAEGTLPTRTIKSTSMQAEGEPGRGLVHSEFTGSVEYRERGSGVNRTATAATLGVALKPAMGGIEDAKFAHGVHFIDGDMSADAAAARYDLEQGVLELTGSEPGAVRPHVVNEQIVIDATRIDVTLAGPDMKAIGAVKSALQTKTGREGGATSDAHLPSMFKRDKPVNVTADALDYNGTANTATYTGNAQLWQEETSIKGKSITLDDRTGDLTAGGGVVTVTVRDELDKNKKPQRVRSIATSTEFRYDETVRRATYAGNAHMDSPNGDMTASKIELYLKGSGDALDRAEAYENVTLRDQKRTTTGARLTYTTSDERYVVTGAPVKVVDECRRETIGKTLTYLKSADTITVDGNEQTRTQTKGNGQCP